MVATSPMRALDILTAIVLLGIVFLVFCFFRFHREQSARGRSSFHAAEESPYLLTRLDRDQNQSRKDRSDI